MLRIYAGRMVAIALMACAGSAAADGPPAAATPAPPTRQALYDSAQAAYDAGNWDAAISGFSQVLVGAKAGSRSTGVIRGRLARALLRRGRIDQAQAAAARAVTEIGQGGARPDADLAEAYLTLGDALRINLDMDAAATAYGQAGAVSTGPGAATLTLSAEVGLILSDMVTHPDVAARAAEALVADKGMFEALPDADRAQILTLLARAEVNLGDRDKALAYSMKALTQSGNMHASRVSLGQVTVRADAGLVAAARNDSPGMHEYFAYAGAGHVNDDWASGAGIVLPVCGRDILPDDTAVIEFSIGDDGRTVGAAPIYASRPGQMGVIFARSVRTWHWRTAAIANLNSFWRASIRLQLRCTTTIELDEPFYAATAAWWDALREKQKLDPAIATSADLTRIDALTDTLIGYNSTLDARAAADAALEPLLEKVAAPPEVRAYALVRSLPANAHGLQGSAALSRADALAAAALRIEAMPGGDRSAAWLRTEQAIALEYNGDFAHARPPLERVAALPPSRLPNDDPIRRMALLHLSMLESAAGHEEAARVRFTEAGLAGDQCSMLDVRPRPFNTGVSDDSFPYEAMRWNFEGWVREAFDIGPDGEVKKVRTVMAYPPFVFAPAAERVVGHLRYLPPTIAGKALGCVGQTMRFKFNLVDGP